MANIQQANSFATWWVGTTPKYGLKKRFRIHPGLTNEECQKRVEKLLVAADLREEKRREEEAYKQSDAFFLTKLLMYKQRELDQLARSIQAQRTANGNRFMGGYTPQAIHDANVEGERINKLEQDKKAEIEKRYDGSKECIERLRQLVREDEEREKQVFTGSGSSPGIPRVGGYAARHAVAHGGGFNHPGVYAGNVFH
jgi:hypothetical protein